MTSVKTVATVNPKITATPIGPHHLGGLHAGLDGALEEVDVESDGQGNETEHRRDGRQKHRTKTDDTRFDDGLGFLVSALTKLADEITKHDGVVHHHAGQGDDTDAGHDDAKRRLQ